MITQIIVSVGFIFYIVGIDFFNMFYICSYIITRYAHVFEVRHIEFLDGFQALTHQAQCLFVRIAGRKGQVFDTRKLSYPEISDFSATLRELEESGFISSVRKDEYSECLTVMTQRSL